MCNSCPDTSCHETTHKLVDMFRITRVTSLCSSRAQFFIWDIRFRQGALINSFPQQGSHVDGPQPRYLNITRDQWISQTCACIWLPGLNQTSASFCDAIIKKYHFKRNIIIYDTSWWLSHSNSLLIICFVCLVLFSQCLLEMATNSELWTIWWTEKSKEKKIKETRKTFSLVGTILVRQSMIWGCDNVLSSLQEHMRETLGANCPDSVSKKISSQHSIFLLKPSPLKRKFKDICVNQELSYKKLQESRSRLSHAVIGENIFNLHFLF